MVHFTTQEPGHHLAPVTYLPGVEHVDEPAGAGERTMSGTLPRSERGSLLGAVPRGVEKTKARASNVSVHQLARRGMSRWELSQVLAKRDVDEKLATAELDRLESVGLLDDAALAVTLVYTQHTRKGLGRAAIGQELKRRHIASEIIDDALSEIDDDDEVERAGELALKRVGQLSSVDDETAKRRLSGFLARKGYSSDVVRRAVDAAMATRRGTVRFR